MHILSVISNLYGTLDMVPGFIPSPQLWEITEYLKKKNFDIPTPKPYVSLFYLCQGGIKFILL